MALIDAELWQGSPLGSSLQGTTLINTVYHDSRSEVLITKAELEAVGLNAGSIINAIKLFITSQPGRALLNVRMGLKHTNANAISNPFQPYSTYTEVFLNPNIPTTGFTSNSWYTFNFTTPFTWNGTDNIILTMIRDGNAWSGGGDVGTKTLTGGRYNGYQSDSRDTFPFDSVSPSYGGISTVPRLTIVADSNDGGTTDPPPDPQPTDSTITTNGLIGYWHYKQGVSGGIWNNIAPDTEGSYNGVINGAIVQANGMYFDGIDDYIEINGNFPLVNQSTYELIVKDIGDQGDIGENHFALFRDNTKNNFLYYINNSGKYRWRVGSDGGNAFATVTGMTPTGHIIITTNGNTTNIYQDGKLLITTSSVPIYYPNGTAVTLRIGRDIGLARPIKGEIVAFRLYDRALTPQEITKNFDNGTKVGLDEPSTSEPPKVTIISQSRTTLSPVPPMDKATLKFKFDQDVTDWAVMVLGSDYSTGTMAGNGKNVAKDTEISVDILHSMLYQEGDNRINIYGKNKDGLWTPYE